METPSIHDLAEEPSKQKDEDIEDAYWNGKRYNVQKLKEFAEQLPTETVPLSLFEDVVSEDNDTWWYGKDGTKIHAPIIVREWEKYKDDPNWTRDTDALKHTNLDNPILVSFDGHVMDGQHRVMKAFIEGKTEIKIKRLPEEIPEEMEMPQ